jgi:hypothetical protein
MEESKGKPVKKTEAPLKKEVKDVKNVVQEKPEKEPGNSGNRNKIIVVALVVAVIIFGLIFAGGSKETKKRPVRKGKN